MTTQFTKDEFIKFVEDLYLTKLKGASISDDSSGYYVRIDNTSGISDRYSITVISPTGCTSYRSAVAPMGITQVAGQLYSQVQELPDESAKPSSRVLFHGNENGVSSPDGYATVVGTYSNRPDEDPEI